MIPSDSTLNRFWRMVVLKLHGGRCIFCGASADYTVVDCHHYIPRKHYLLRWDHRNGIPVCRYSICHVDGNHSLTCHQYAATPAGRKMIESILDVKYLQQVSLLMKKQYLQSRRLTDKKFREIKKLELSKILLDNSN